MTVTDSNDGLDVLKAQKSGHEGAVFTWMPTISVCRVKLSSNNQLFGLNNQDSSPGSRKRLSKGQRPDEGKKMHEPEPQAGF